MRIASSCLLSEDIAVIREGWTEVIGDDQLQQSHRREKRYEENSRRRPNGGTKKEERDY